MAVADIHLSGAASNGGTQTDPLLSLGNFRAASNVQNDVDIETPTNVTGVVIDKVSAKHNFKPVTGTLTSLGNTVQNAGLNTPTGAATWKPSGGDTVKLLLNMGFKTVVEDESLNAHVITHNGSVATINTTSPFTEGWSLVCDGINDYLSTPDNADWFFNSNDFTIRVRVKTTSAGTETIIGQWATTGNQRSWKVRHVNGVVSFIGSTDGIVNNSFVVSSTTSINDGAWHDITAVRFGNTQLLFIDGTKEGTDGTFTGALHDSTSSLTIGAENIGTPAAFFTGNITAVLIDNGIAQETSNFTPATKQTIGKGATKLLVNMNGADTSTTFTDESKNAHTITTNGNAQVDTSTDPFGTGDGSLLLDGTGDYLSLPDHADFAFLGDDFTIRGRVKTVSGITKTIISQWTGTGNQRGWIIQAAAAGTMLITVSSNGTATLLTLTSTTAINDGSWHEFEFTRSGDNWRLFVDGTLEGSTTNSGTMHDSTTTVLIGARDAGTEEFNGNIDAIEIVRGVSENISNYTPPTSERSVAATQNIEFTALSDTVREEEHPISSTDEISRSDTQTSFIRVNTGTGAVATSSSSITVNNAVGVLTYTSSGTVLQYTGPNDTIGLGVNVGAGGTFEIASNDIDLFINVTVTGGSLPGTDQVDNLIITQANNTQNIFNNLSDTVATAGQTDYRCVYIRNNSGVTLNGLGFYIEQESLNLQTEYEIAIERPDNDATGKVQTIASPTTAPTGLTFSKPTFSAPLAIAQTDLPNGDMYGVWIKRVVPSGTTLLSNNIFQFGLKYSF